MSTSTPSGSSIAKRAIAVLILVVVAWILFHAVIGFVMSIFWIGLAIAAVFAIIWALRTLRIL